MTDLRDWSITASANTGNAVDGFMKEGIAYSDVNNAYREGQAIHARALADSNGALVTTGGTSSYVLAINATLTAYQDGDMVAFQAHAKNDGASTLRLRMPDGTSLSDRPMVKTNLAALEDGDIVAGGTYQAFYKSASANWQIIGVPIETGVVRGDVSISGSLSVTGPTTFRGEVTATASVSIAGSYKPQRIIKSADESVNNSVTLQDDNHLVGFSIAAATTYRIRGVLWFDSQVSGCGIQAKLDFDNDPAALAGVGIAADRSKTMAGDAIAAASGGFYIVEIDGSALAETTDMVMVIDAIVLGHATLAATLNLQWAMDTAQVGNLTLKADASYMEVEQITDLP